MLLIISALKNTEKPIPPSLFLHAVTISCCKSDLGFRSEIEFPVNHPCWLHFICWYCCITWSYSSQLLRCCDSPQYLPYHVFLLLSFRVIEALHWPSFELFLFAKLAENTIQIKLHFSFSGLIRRFLMGVKKMPELAQIVLQNCVAGCGVEQKGWKEKGVLLMARSLIQLIKLGLVWGSGARC